MLGGHNVNPKVVGSLVFFGSVLVVAGLIAAKKINPDNFPKIGCNKIRAFYGKGEENE